jgi:ABC-type amino acid transport substrate-binding protein
MRPYRVGRDPAWYGLSLDGQEQAVTAFCDDLLLHLGRSEGMRLELVSLGWHQLEQALEKGTVDAIVTAAQPTCQQEKCCQFSNGFLAIGPVLVTRMESPGDCLADYNGKLVAVRTDSPTQLVLATLPAVVMRPYDAMAVALHDVLWRKVDAAALNLLSAAQYTRNLYCGKLRIATDPLSSDALRMAVRRNSTKGMALLDEFEKAMARLREGGVYRQLVGKWGLAQPPFEPCLAGEVNGCPVDAIR